MERLTADKSNGNFQTLMNFARAENHRVILDCAGGEEGIDLCEYISRLANRNGCKATPKEVMEGDMCGGCDCEVTVLNICAIQAAELRERLKAYEDLGRTPEELARLVEKDAAKQVTADADARAFGVYAFDCPACGYENHIEAHRGNHCFMCGQRIDWVKEA